MNLRTVLFSALALLTLLPMGAVAEAKKETPATKKPAPEDVALEILRRIYVQRDFSNIWSLLSDRDREINGNGSVRFLSTALKWSHIIKKKKKASETDKALAEAILQVCGDRKREDLAKLSAAKRVAMLYTIRDKQRQIDKKPPTGCARILLEKTRVVAKVVRGERCTFIVENRWKYRRKRSELVMVREGGTWRFRRPVRLHVVGPHALGEKGLTVSKERKKELRAAVHMMIAPPRKDPPDKNRKDPVDRKEIRAIGPLAAPVAVSFLTSATAKKKHKRNAVTVLRALGEEAAGAIPQLEKMFRSKDRTSQRAAADVFATLGRAGVPVLIKMLEGKQSETAARAVAVLRRLAPSGVLPLVVVPALVRALQRDTSLQVHALDALVKYHARRLALRPTAGMLRDKEADVRAAAAIVLGTVPFRKEAVAVLGDLRAALKSENDKRAKKAIAYAILIIETAAKKKPAKGGKGTGGK